MPLGSNTVAANATKYPKGVSALVYGGGGGGGSASGITSQPSNPYFTAISGTNQGGGSAGGDVKTLPFQKKTTSTPNMSLLNPAFTSQMANLQTAAPDYSSYFQQLSGQAFDQANQGAARIAAQHGGAPTASTGNTGQNQGAYQGMLYDQLNKSNVDRMWNTQDQWEQNKYNQGASAYQNYFNAIANKAYGTEEGGFSSGIYNPRGGGSDNPYANSTFGTYGGAGSGAGGAGGGGGTTAGRNRTAGTGGGGDPSTSTPGGAPNMGGGGGNGEWGGQAYNPENPYLGMGNTEEPGYGQQTGEGWLNGGSGYGTPNGNWGEPTEGPGVDPYGGTGGLNSYLTEIAQSGAGQEPQGYEDYNTMPPGEYTIFRDPGSGKSIYRSTPGASKGGGGSDVVVKR